ncbi:MAG: PaaI family thioesterase [Owenweeksia sp.]|nr:PaaI family thioesterase [Owenweeksia sp.]
MNKQELLDRFNAICKDTLMETLEIRFTDVDVEAGRVKVEMPVTSKVHQPMGLLHGGASAAIAESVGSASSLLYVDPEKYAVLGIQLPDCSHLRSVKAGVVSGTAQIIHKGRSTHLWEVRITDEQGKLISHCKLTNMIMEK